MEPSVDDFDEWYAAMHPRLVTALVVLSGDVELASEAADEACVRALERWRSVSTMTSPDGWAYRVGVNVVRRRQRRRAMEQRLLRRIAPRPAVSGPTGEVWQLLSELAERQRLAVVLRFVADLTEPEIAEVMGVTRGTVNATLRAAMARLRIELDADDHPDADPVIGGSING